MSNQNDRNCLGNIIKFEKNSNNIFLPARGHFKVNYCKVFNIGISPWARIGHHAPQLLIHTNFILSFDMSKTWNEMLSVKK